MGIKVLRPDVKKSSLNFDVDDENNIRIGLYGVKGVGESAAKSLVEERKNGGEFKDLEDLIKRINLRSLTGKSIESRVYGGGLDCFGIDRSRYFERSDIYDNYFELMV